MKHFALLLLSLSSVFAFRSIYRQQELLPSACDVAGAEDQYFEQVLDHFNAIDERTWQQRYWENLEHHVEGGPAFIMIGGEAEANPKWMTYGQWYKWAQENGAAMFELEHRYYGQSQPTEDMSTDNMRYLSSRQGLEDLGHFMTAMNNKYNLTGSWVTFGGSYPGSLSAWMSLRFPHLVAGSVSSSGPLFAKLDYFEYLQVVSDALDTTGSGCNVAMTEALTAVENLVGDADMCLDHTYASFLAQLSETSWSGEGVGWRQWIWQTCTEFGWYQTTNQESGVYGHTLPLEFFEQWCQDAFGAQFTHEMMEKSVAGSNIEYGGYEPSVNNVVFVHGSIDPWHAMGVLEDLHEGAPSIYITGTSHCADMYADSSSDPEELTAARIRIGELVHGWVENAKK